MATPIAILLTVLGVLLAIFLAVILLIYLIVPAMRGVGWLVRHVFEYILGTLSDLVRFVGAVLTTLLFVPLVLGSIVIGRWSASAHYGRAVSTEVTAAGMCVYRVLLARPLRLFMLHGLLEGVESRIPAAIAEAPGRDTPPKRQGEYTGYRVVGSLPGGGSGSKLYIADPEPMKLAALERSGHTNVEQVVIKSFSLRDGSSLPQIVRESRALDAAKKLGLVLEHEMGSERFFYVMRYVPGESLTAATRSLHAAAGERGLDSAALKRGLGYVSDLLDTLDHYHRGGLWHKDVKPDNIIVHDHEAHLVDFGLVTSMRSSMTLTTHGTEYFRDPEMVRMALKGVKVHQVDGRRFDLYAAGAVLYSVVENSFPAHGGLSQVSKRCPDALRWIIRRAMTDYDKRYTSASQMLADLLVLSHADDPFAVKPAQLPSVMGGLELDEEPVHVEPESIEVADSPVPSVMRRTPTPDAFARAQGGAAAAANAPHGASQDTAAPAPGVRSRPRLSVANWWTGRYHYEGSADAAPVDATPAEPRVGDARFSPSGPAAGSHPGAGVGVVAGVPRVLDADRRPSAAEQLASARSRMHERRQRAHDRIHARRGGRSKARFQPLNPGVALVLFMLLSAAVAVAFALLMPSFRQATHQSQARLESAQQMVAPQEFFADGIDSLRSGLGKVYRANEQAVLGVIQDEDNQRLYAMLADQYGLSAEEVQRVIDKALSSPSDSGDTGFEFVQADPDVVQLASRLGTVPPGAGRTLVLNDFSAPMDESLDHALDRALRAMHVAGFQLFGETPKELSSRELTDRQQVDLMAAARRAQGRTTLDTHGSTQPLLTWLGSQPGVDLVLWLAPSGKESLRYAVITDRGARISEPIAMDAPNLAQRLARDASRPYR